MSLFSGPSAPPPPPPAPGSTGPSQAELDARAIKERKRLLAGGSASNILTSSLGDTSKAPTASSVLLGG